MAKKLQPGDRFNRFQAKKQARVVKKDPQLEKEMKDILTVAQMIKRGTRKGLSIMGLI